jgi:hypothetical protein
VPRLVAAVTRALASHATITGRVVDRPSTHRAEHAASD